MPKFLIVKQVYNYTHNYYDGEANIKRLFLEGSKITMKPDNDIFPTKSINKQEAEVNGFKTFGRIVFAPRFF